MGGEGLRQRRTLRAGKKTGVQQACASGWALAWGPMTGVKNKSLGNRSIEWSCNDLNSARARLPSGQTHCSTAAAVYKRACVSTLNVSHDIVSEMHH